MRDLDFIAFHEAALEADEIRHSLLLSMIGRLRSSPEPSNILTWTLGGAGECAMQAYGHPIIFGNLSQEQCRGLAEITKDKDYPGVVGPDETAIEFAEYARGLGLEFSEGVPQQIQVLRTDPAAPKVPGFARHASPDDFEIFNAWTIAFIREAVPNDPIPTASALRATLEQGRHWFWIADGKAVSMAAIARKTKGAATINSVFTPPEHRNQGFAGAVTAAASRQIFSQGRSAVCLYTDLRNPASNRCYAKLGFLPICNSWHIIRQKTYRS
jgi:RimJ/RimL family protein N-acetyltransferase